MHKSKITPATSPVICNLPTRERTDLTTDTESVPIYVDRIRFRSSERSVTDLAIIRRIVCFI